MLVWLVDGSPGDVNRRSGIRVSRVSAGYTGEHRLIETIRFGDVTTYGTSLAGVLGINKDHWNTRQHSLVGDVLSQLIERPVSELAPLLATKPRPIANACQVLKGYRSFGDLRFLNKTLANRMVGVALKSGLLTRDFLKFTLCGFSLFLLQILAQMLMLMAVILYCFATVVFSITVGCKVHDAKIASKNIMDILRFWRFNIAGCEKIKLTMDKNKITFPSLTLKKFFLALTTCIRDTLTTIDRPYRNIVQIDIPFENAVIKSNRSMWLKGAPCLAVDFVRIGNLRDDANNDLRGKWKSLTNIVIGQFVERELTKDLLCPCLLRDVVASGIRNLKCSFERTCLIWRRLKSNFRCQFHVYDYTAFVNMLKGDIPHSSPA